MCTCREITDITESVHLILLRLELCGDIHVVPWELGINPSCLQTHAIAFLLRLKARLRAEENHIRVPSGDFCQKRRFEVTAQIITCNMERENGMSASGISLLGPNNPLGASPLPRSSSSSRTGFPAKPTRWKSRIAP